MTGILKHKPDAGETRHIKMTPEDKVYNIIFTIVFALVGLICVYPFYYLIICTISEQQAVSLNQVFLLPTGINFDNYIEIFQVQGLAQAAFISVARTVITTAISLVFTSYGAYIFTKQNMWGHKIWYRFVVVTMYFSAGMIPIYMNNRLLGLTNTFWIYVVPLCLSVYNMVLVKTSIESMSPDILATVSLFTAVNQWNDFFTTQMYVTNTKLYTLQFLLYELLNQVTAAADQIANENPYATITPVGIRLTLTAIVTIPIICVYPFVQKFYVKGIMVGAVKG